MLTQAPALSGMGYLTNNAPYFQSNKQFPQHVKIAILGFKVVPRALLLQH
ncbi:hypothetical protein KSD_09280 [Ktedonobacter sp. SOSP1-85]|nr:hypothetical protein KSD_09280 [Ktedonobacter sp. SOSP1-85]